MSNRVVVDYLFSPNDYTISEDTRLFLSLSLSLSLLPRTISSSLLMDVHIEEELSGYCTPFFTFDLVQIYE